MSVPKSKHLLQPLNYSIIIWYWGIGNNPENLTRRSILGSVCHTKECWEKHHKESLRQTVEKTNKGRLCVRKVTFNLIIVVMSGSPGWFKQLNITPSTGSGSASQHEVRKTWTLFISWYLYGIWMLSRGIEYEKHNWVYALGSKPQLIFWYMPTTSKLTICQH